MNPGNVYTVSFEGVAATVVQDLFEINASSTKSLRVLGLFLSQYTEEGDAQDELLRVRVRRGLATSGSGGSTSTPAALNPSSSAASFTAEINNTTQASTGSPVTLHVDAFNVRAGYVLILPPEMQWIVPASGRLTIELNEAPTDSVTLGGTLYVEEIG
jgi:hypothetical protein